MFEDIKLTKEANYLICILYKEYLERRQCGVPREDAGTFRGSKYIHNEFLSEWQYKDVVAACQELDEVGLLRCYCSDSNVLRIKFESRGIAYMESSFQRNISSVIDCLTNIKKLISLF